MIPPKYRDELTRYLSDEWNSIVDNDIDGDGSEPKRLDETNKRYGVCSAARRISRTVFLGSAPSSKEQRNRGIEDVRIMLGVVQPKEHVSVFRDALSSLSNKLTYLYYQSNRYWYDSHPNLRKTVDDRAGRLPEEEVSAEIHKRLHSYREKGEFAGIHIAPESADVPDECEVRLVVLPPKAWFKKDTKLCEAIYYAKEILDKRGNIPRQYRNMLIFLAADQDSISTLDVEMRRYLAWQSVVDDQEALNLDAHQRRQAQESVEKMNQTVNLRLNESYVWLLVPTQVGTHTISLEPIKITRGDGSLIARASKQIRSDELLITKWSPALLKNELDKWLWKKENHISMQKLWECFASYPYLPRLKDVFVLTECVKDGVRSRDFFGYASSVEDSGKYLGLEFGNPGANIIINSMSVLVKKEIAFKQVEVEEKKKETPSGVTIGEKPEGGLKPSRDISKDSKAVYKRFYAITTLEATRLSRDVGLIVEEVIQHLATLPSAELDISLEIKARIPDGIPEKTANVIIENCKTLKFKTSDFEKE